MTDANYAPNDEAKEIFRHVVRRTGLQYDTVEDLFKTGWEYSYDETSVDLWKRLNIYPWRTKENHAEEQEAPQEDGPEKDSGQGSNRISGLHASQRGEGPIQQEE